MIMNKITNLCRNRTIPTFLNGDGCKLRLNFNIRKDRSVLIEPLVECKYVRLYVVGKRQIVESQSY